MSRNALKGLMQIFSDLLNIFSVYLCSLKPIEMGKYCKILLNNTHRDRQSDRETHKHLCNIESLSVRAEHKSYLADMANS